VFNDLTGIHACFSDINFIEKDRIYSNKAVGRKGHKVVDYSPYYASNLFPYDFTG
jgi:hypothetical protein